LKNKRKITIEEVEEAHDKLYFFKEKTFPIACDVFHPHKPIGIMNY
jgi:hypothetical protein